MFYFLVELNFTKLQNEKRQNTYNDRQGAIAQNRELQKRTRTQQVVICELRTNKIL